MKRLPQIVILLLGLCTPLVAQAKIIPRPKISKRSFYRIKDITDTPKRVFYRSQKPMQNSAAINNEIDLHSDRTDLLLKRARFYLYAGIDSSFQRDLQRALNREPDNDSILRSLSQLLMELPISDRCEKVIAVTTAYMLKHQKSDVAYGSRAKAKICLGYQVDAFDDLTAAIEINPLNFSYEMDRVNIPYRVMDTKKALELHQKLINYYADIVRNEKLNRGAKTTLASAYVSRSFTYQKIGDKSSQLADLATAVRLQPENNLRMRASIYEGYKMYDDAIVDLTTYLELLKQEPFRRGIIDAWGMYVYRGRIYIEAGKFDEAIIDYQKALELYPTNKVWIEARIAEVKQKQSESQKTQQIP